MLMPRKVKHRKQHRGRMAGKAKGGVDLAFGDFGIHATTSAAGTHHALGRAGRGTDGHRVAGGHGGLAHDLLVVVELVGQDVALVDPHLHPDATGRSAGLTKAVVDVCPQGVQGHATFAVGLAARHLRAPETSRGLDAHA